MSHTKTFKTRNGTFLTGCEYNYAMNKELLQQAKQDICKPSESVSSERLPSSMKTILGSTPENFLTMYNPSAGARLLSKNLSSGQVAKLDNIPRLCDVSGKYGQGVAAKWIDIQLLNIDTLQGQALFTPEAKAEVTSLILSAYGDMTIAELLNFFARYKIGEYTEATQYYGGIQKILIALRHYRTMRDDDLIRLERDQEYQRAEQERNERAGKCISYEEYQRTKLNKL